MYFIQDRILLQPNLSVYVCEAPSWRLEPRPLPPTPHKHLYLWNDHRTKGVQWFRYYILYRYRCIKLTKIVSWISVRSYAYNN